MPLPFRSGQDTPQRSGADDPFLEFAAEPLSRTSAPAPLVRPDPSARPDPWVPTDPQFLGQIAPKPAMTAERRSAINPAFTFALGVAGLVTAVVAYYQLAQVLSTRSTTPTVVTASPLITPSAPPEPARQRANPQTPVAPPGTERAAAIVAPASGPVARPAPRGWTSFDTAIDLQVFEGGRVLGNTNTGRIELSEGPHELTLVNNEYEIRQAMSISVVRDRIARVTVTLPTASLSINALPWADVWIDGEPVGTTPLANLSVPVGIHEVVWKHPTLGERRQSVTAKAKTPVRIGVEFIK